MEINIEKTKEQETAVFQIRTNSRSFGEHFGVYEIGAPDTRYRTYCGDTFVDENRRVWTFDEKHHKDRYTSPGAGRFVKQLSYDHGTFEMAPAAARKLCEKLQKNTRGAWVRLYAMA